ncbi:SDR family NAD(P)-dependent oxidoreductase [Falsiroseomonas sp.]|uniref:SDR family NAD(P)-dependent oxidoreductase n=1 Tax=Falsiroseomonas sp. TaxID=2870721 RepID=UPI003562261E
MPLSTQRFTGRLVAITGAANGIGRATALRFADEGATLALFDVEADQLDATAAECRARGATATAFVADLTNRAAVEDAFARIGPLDVLFNNVGQSAREKSRPFHESDPDTWRFVLNVSLVTTMLVSRQVVPGMRDRGAGRIINMSTESAFYGDVGMVDYAAAKMGVIGFTRSLARELAPFHVNVNAVAPGAIRTRAHDRLPREVIDKVRNSVPMGFVAEPEDVSGVVAFLASDDARYVTGQTLLIDGGRWMI